MCECYKIGGPWIAEDPDCPVHGQEAVAERDKIETRLSALEAELRLSEYRTEEQIRDKLRILREYDDVVSHLNKELAKANKEIEKLKAKLKA